MADPTYLEVHPPARSQYRRPRRAEPSGAIVVHTAENVPDLDGPDGGAEGVARFISTRTDPGSYHTVVDADSIVRVVPYDAEAYGEGTGGNPYALHLSFAVKTGTWDELEPARLAAIVHNGAKAAAEMARWLVANGHRPPGAVRMTADAYRRKAPGFISHAELDPRRRSDPGASFPWGAFLDLYAQELHMPTTAPLPENDPGARIQRAINANGLQPPLDIDGDCGKVTADGLDKVLAYLNAQVTKWQAANAASASERDQARARATQLADAVKTSADTITRLTAERDELRRAGGPRLEQLKAVDASFATLESAMEGVADAIAKARA